MRPGHREEEDRETEERIKNHRRVKTTHFV